MDGRMLDRRWFAGYAALCAALMIAGNAFGQLSEWSEAIVGGTNCDSQQNLLLGQKQCDVDDNNYHCDHRYDVCNQLPGNATKICQVQAGAEACKTGSGSNHCVPHKNDALSGTDAQGNPCAPQQIE